MKRGRAEKEERKQEDTKFLFSKEHREISKIKKKEKKAVGERKFRAEQNFSKKNREGKRKEGAGEKHRGLLLKMNKIEEEKQNKK